MVPTELLTLGIQKNACVDLIKECTILQCHLFRSEESFALLCFALLCFALLCFALLCFALLWFCFAFAFALLCFALLCFALLLPLLLPLLCFALLCFALLWFALVLLCIWQCHKAGFERERRNDGGGMNIC